MQLHVVVGGEAVTNEGYSLQWKVVGCTRHLTLPEISCRAVVVFFSSSRAAAASLLHLSNRQSIYADLGANGASVVRNSQKRQLSAADQPLCDSKCYKISAAKLSPLDMCQTPCHLIPLIPLIPGPMINSKGAALDICQPPAT